MHPLSLRLSQRLPVLSCASLNVAARRLALAAERLALAGEAFTQAVTLRVHQDQLESRPPLHAGLGLWDQTRTARELGRSEATLTKWRSERRGPRFFKVGGEPRYAPADVQDWLLGQRRSFDTGSGNRRRT